MDKKRKAVTKLLPATGNDIRADARKALCTYLEFDDNIEVRSKVECDKFLRQLLEWGFINQRQHDLEDPVDKPLPKKVCKLVIEKCHHS